MDSGFGCDSSTLKPTQVQPIEIYKDFVICKIHPSIDKEKEKERKRWRTKTNHTPTERKCTHAHTHQQKAPNHTPPESISHTPEIAFHSRSTFRVQSHPFDLYLATEAIDWEVAPGMEDLAAAALI